MGNEAVCTLRYAGKSLSGRALLESSEITFRGDDPLKIPFSAIAALQAENGELHVRTKDGLAIFELGPQASKWRDKIANPKSLLDKLGVKPGDPVSLMGKFPADFLASLKQHRAVITQDRVAKDSAWIFLAVAASRELRRLPSLSKSMRGATALWIVYPKGQKSIREADVRSAGLKSGLVDIKVASFSPTHTALKFVIPRSKR
ncbi:MAG: hypothetical protein WBL63_07695 [Candidatus Acidiferrum sp.]